MDPITLALLGVGLVSSIISWGSSSSAQETEMDYNTAEAAKNRKHATEERLASQQYQTDMWNKTNDWNLEQWNRENEYNSLSSQLERAKLAGVNPNSLFGQSIQGNLASGNKSATPMSSAGLGLSSPAHYASGLASTLLDTGNSIGVRTADMLNMLAERNLKEYNLAYDQMTQEQRIAILDANYKSIMAEAGLKDANEQTVRTTLKTLASKNAEELKILSETYNKLYNENKNLLKDLDVKDATISNINQDTKVKEQDALLKEAQTATEFYEQELKASQSYREDAQSYKLQQEGETASYEAELKKIELQLANDFNVPIDSPEHVFLVQLLRDGKLGDVLNNVYRNLERVKWKPSETTTGYDNKNSLSLGFLGDWGWKSSHYNTNMDEIKPQVVGW